MNRKLRIATRESRLATWQAQFVQQQLEAAGISTEIVFIKSEGDINLTTPLYELGVQGIFTRSLDIALLEQQADIAVHSYKDIPTQPALGLLIGAVLKRGNHKDTLVFRDNQSPVEADLTSIQLLATSSIRRKAQWLYRFPSAKVENIRGNVNTRLKKLNESAWDAAIFAAAGLERLGLTQAETGGQLELDWMIPAPAQGAIAVTCRANDDFSNTISHILHHEETHICTSAERNFLRWLQGGCSTPISAYAEIKSGRLIFKGNVTSNDGKTSLDVVLESDADDTTLAEKAADEMKARGFENLIR